MSLMGQLHALPRRSIAVRFTPVSGIDSRSQALPSRAKSRHGPRAATEEEQIRGGDLRFSILNSKCGALHGCVSSDEPKLLSANQPDGFRYRS
jgi:hypothetical protein